MSMTCKLSELPLKTTAVVTGFCEQNALTQRIRNLGFTEGAAVTPLFKSPFGDPVAYAIKDCVVALRKTDCDGVTVTITGDRNG